jgi:hypothetical protein
LFRFFFFFFFLFVLTCRPCPVGQHEQCHFRGRAPVCQPAAVRETRPYVFFPCQALLAQPGQCFGGETRHATRAWSGCLHPRDEGAACCFAVAFFEKSVGTALLTPRCRMLPVGMGDKAAASKGAAAAARGGHVSRLFDQAKQKRQEDAAARGSDFGNQDAGADRQSGRDCAVLGRL